VKNSQLFPSFKWGRGEKTVSQAHAHNILWSHKLTFFCFRKKTGLKLKINMCENVNWNEMLLHKNHCLVYVSAHNNERVGLYRLFMPMRWWRMPRSCV
jgi:hypothetical protein